jgi:hypothetical protein
MTAISATDGRSREDFVRFARELSQATPSGGLFTGLSFERVQVL